MDILAVRGRSETPRAAFAVSSSREEAAIIMANPNNELRMNEDHVGGHFRWEVEPACRCGKTKQAVEDGFLFVSNFADQGFNQFYIMPLAADGELFRSSGVPILNCPWCGDPIKGKKLYPKK
jgi:hypothetical protein